MARALTLQHHLALVWQFSLLMYFWQTAIVLTLSNNLDLNDGSSNASTRKQNSDRKLGRVDPQGSWLTFVRHSSIGDSRRRGGNAKLRNRQKSNSRRILYVPGPRGPPGARGPRGPAGATMTKDYLLKQFKDMVREEASRRAQAIVAIKCPRCPNNYTRLAESLIDIGDVSIIPKVSAAFHCRLRQNTVVTTKTFLELKKFQLPFGGGAFQRGNVFNTKEGRFTAPRDGIYQFSLIVHLSPESTRRRNLRRRLRKRDNVRILICIESLCQKHTSLEFITGIESNSKVFTVNLTGMLELQTGQYTSVYLDNSSSKSIIVQSGSYFSGSLMGV